MNKVNNIIKDIINQPVFNKLKTIKENNQYHKNESVYNHLLRTLETAKEKINGKFIDDPEARSRYMQFIDKKIEDCSNKDALLLTALLHDVGKSFSYRENNNMHSIIVSTDNITRCPGHEYWGSTIAEKILEKFRLPKDLIEKIKNY